MPQKPLTIVTLYSTHDDMKLWLWPKDKRRQEVLGSEIQSDYVVVLLSVDLRLLLNYFGNQFTHSKDLPSYLLYSIRSDLNEAHWFHFDESTRGLDQSHGLQLLQVAG